MRVRLFLLASLLSVITTINIHAQTDVNNAQAIFIYNFLSHFKWPDNAVHENYIIGVIGKTPTSDYLKKYTAARKVGGKGVEIKELKSPNEATNCQILFITNTKAEELAKIEATLQNSNCLIISETPGAIDKGAAVDFRIADGKLRYKINQTNVDSHNLFVSKQLLSMSL